MQASENLAEHPARMSGAKGFPVDARREEPHRMQPAWKVRIEALAEILQVIFGKTKFWHAW